MSRQSRTTLYGTPGGLVGTVIVASLFPLIFGNRTIVIASLLPACGPVFGFVAVRQAGRP